MRFAIKKEKQNQYKISKKAFHVVDGIFSPNKNQNEIHQEEAFLFIDNSPVKKTDKTLELEETKISKSAELLAFAIGKIISLTKSLGARFFGQSQKGARIILSIISKVAEPIMRNKFARKIFSFLKLHFSKSFIKLWKNKIFAGVRPLQEKLKKFGFLKFFFRRLTQKSRFRRLHFQMIILAVVILAVTGFIFFRETKVGAYTYAWVQTEWDAAANPTSITSHNASQNGRTDDTGYQAKDANIQINNLAPGDSQLTLSTVNGTPWTEASSSDFNAGAQSNTYVNGNSVSLKKNNGVSCGGNIECTAGNCGTDFSSGQYCHATASSCVDYALGSPWEQVNGYVKCSGTSYSKACSNGVWGAQVNNPNPSNSYCDGGGGAQTGYDLAATCTSGVGGGFSNSCHSCNYYMASSTSSCKTSCTADSDCWPGGAYGCVSNACVVIDPCMGVTSVTQGSLTYNTVNDGHGRCWLDRNLGATEVATSSTDSNAYGWYFQWGRLADGHQIPTSGTTTTQSSSDTPGNSNFIYGSSDWRSPQNDNLWGSTNGYINNPCPTGWHVPTQSEWSSAVSALGITNSSTAFSSALKLPLAGYRHYYNASLNNQGSDGFYWSSSPNGSNAYYLDFYSSGVYPALDYNRAYGYSVRCLKN